MLEDIKLVLSDLSDEKRIKSVSRYFKKGDGEYGEGDEFIGVLVPDQRMVAKEFYKNCSLNDVQNLLNSSIHEYRLTATFILVNQYEKAKEELVRQSIVDFYLMNTKKFNNWDLVDSGCYKILGHFAYHQNREEILYRLADSDFLWEKRMAIVSTYYFIKKDEMNLSFDLILKNINDSHDLIHKANGWMLREIGKRKEEVLLSFLDQYALQLPRTTLRYAIEKLDETLRQYYLQLKK